MEEFNSWIVIQIRTCFKPKTSSFFSFKVFKTKLRMEEEKSNKI